MTTLSLKLNNLSFRQGFSSSTHVFHQYTLKVKKGLRAKLQAHLAKHDIASAIYYPVPLYKQKAFEAYYYSSEPLPITENTL